LILEAHCWGRPTPERVVCIHGVTQNGRIFEPLGKRLADRGHSVLALDLRGHGASPPEPPWHTAAHAQDVLETLESHGVGSAIWVGHSFGARVAATIAAGAWEGTRAVILLEPGLEIPSERALRGAEIDRLDWSFATREGAVEALMASDSVVAAPRQLVADYVRKNIKQGPDGRFRFNFCPGAVVTAWSEMSRPAPHVARVKTLIVEAEVPLVAGMNHRERYSEALGEALTTVTVPNGHNVLWEATEETISTIEAFLESIGSGTDGGDDELPGYVNEAGRLHPLF
jgi:lipase